MDQGHEITGYGICWLRNLKLPSHNTSPLNRVKEVKSQLAWNTAISIVQLEGLVRVTGFSMRCWLRVHRTTVENPGRMKYSRRYSAFSSLILQAVIFTCWSRSTDTTRLESRHWHGRLTRAAFPWIRTNCLVSSITRIMIWSGTPLARLPKVN